MLSEIKDYMKKIINIISPEVIYIVTDGVAPLSKMAQQRDEDINQNLKPRMIM